jgi:cytochrome P450
MSTVIDRKNHTQFPDNRDLSHIPGDDGYPVIGRLPTMLSEGGVLALAQDQYARFGAVSRCSPGTGVRAVMVLGPDHVQRLLLDKDQEFSVEKGYEYALTTFFGRGVLSYDFEEHKVQRRILQTGFKTPAMRGYVDTMQPVMARGIADWAGDDFEFFSNIKQLLLDVAGEVFFGTPAGSEENKRLVQAFLDILVGQMGIIRKEWPGLKFNKGMKARRTVEASIRALLPGRRGSDKTDMLTHMCNATKEDGSHFTDQEIIEHANFLLFAAHDTTTSALCHLIFFLARHQEWQQKLREECASLGTATPSYDDLDKLVLCEQAFKESLRLHNSVPIMVRRTTKDTEIGGYKVPACTVVTTIPSFSHYMEEYWTDPTTFDPDRFSPERAEHKRHSMAFMAFGGGAHTCIGMHFAIMSARLFLTQFLAKYKFEPAEGASERMNAIPLPRPADGARIKLTEI